MNEGAIYQRLRMAKNNVIDSSSNQFLVPDFRYSKRNKVMWTQILRQLMILCSTLEIVQRVLMYVSVGFKNSWSLAWYLRGVSCQLEFRLRLS